MATKSAVFGATTPDFPSVILDLDDGPFGVPAPAVVASVRRLLNFSFGEQDFASVRPEEFDHEARRDYADLQAQDTSGTASLSLLLYLSTYFHEIRHAHDLLSTHYGQEILGRHLNLFQNSDAIVQLLFQWQDQSNTPIPLPLRPDVPVAGDQIAELLRRHNELTTQLAAYRQRQARGVDIEQVLEASAVNAQAGFIYDIFGRDGLDQLNDFMVDSGRGELYFSIHAEFASLWQKYGDHPGGGGVLGFLLWSSLNPPVKVGGSPGNAPHPADVLEAMMTVAKHEMRSSNPPTIESLQRKLDEAYGGTGFESYDQSTERIRSWQQRRHQGLLRLRDSASVRSLAAAIAGFDSIRSFIKHTPEIYFNPQNYPWTIMRGYLPAVIVRVRYQGEIHNYVSKGQSYGEVAEAVEAADSMATFRLLLCGRDSSHPRWLEDLVFDALTSGDRPLRFEDGFFS